MGDIRLGFIFLAFHWDTTGSAVTWYLENSIAIWDF